MLSSCNSCDIHLEVKYVQYVGQMATFYTLRYLKCVSMIVLMFVSLQNHADDTLRQEVVTLQEEKNTYETTAKVRMLTTPRSLYNIFIFWSRFFTNFVFYQESLKRVLEEKLEAVRKLSDLEVK